MRDFCDSKRRSVFKKHGEDSIGKQGRENSYRRKDIGVGVIELQMNVMPLKKQSQRRSFILSNVKGLLPKT